MCITIWGYSLAQVNNLTEPPSLRRNEYFRFIETFYYNHGDRCNLLYTDTESLLLEIKTEDVYKDMAEEKDLYDFSNYSKDNKDHILCSNINTNVIGKFKDERV